MVETITPVVYGGSRSRWGWLLALHVAGATAAAAAFGALLGVAGALLGAPWGRAGLALVATLAGLYLVKEVLGVPIPVPQLRRQVPDWWRTFFPFGPASFLYGVGLGVGFLTYLSHGTLVVVSAAAVASGRPLLGAVLLGSFGLARGSTAVVAVRARTPDQGSALVDRLAGSASWAGWRVAHATALVLVIAAAWAATPGVASAPGEVAAAILAVAFGAAAAAKVAGARSWRRSLASYRLPAAVERIAGPSVPAVEIVLAAMPFVGLVSSAGLASLVVLGLFSAAIVAGRIRVGRRLDCGCFGASSARDYRVLLVRNGALAVAAVVAWQKGVDDSLGGALGMPSGPDLLPAALVLLGLGLAAWVAVQTLVVVRRGAGR
jgi:hypothetical protein